MKRCEVWWVQFDPALSTEIKTSYSGEAQIRCLHCDPIHGGCLALRRSL